ncbi:MAG TPA: hypothetical protein VGR57_20030 [Ktedonobacterales bacterium]|nr:hypothetical protein [Ktedonobacterales bacterium]
MRSTHQLAHNHGPALVTVPWWRSRTWYRYLHDLLLFRGRRRYGLSISEQHPLGATDKERRQVLINPLKVYYPAHPSGLRQIRHAPRAPDAFLQAIAVALVEHEAGHIRHSGDKPAATMLGWLWNALEDERQERLQTQAYPELGDLFDFLGDAIWREAEPSDALLDGCLLWRWEHDLPQDQRKFRATPPAEHEQWHARIRPLVEAAWSADTSDAVTAIAQAILRDLGIAEDAPLPDTLPPTICACGSGEAGGREDGKLPVEAPPPPEGARIPGRQAGVGHGTGAITLHLPEADPSPMLAAVEGAARDLARWLRPLTPQVRTRPDPSRGDLAFERAIAGHARPFDAKAFPAPAPSRAWLLLVDLSGSMGDADQPQSPLYGAVRTAMWLDRAAELAGLAFGILAFNDGDLPLPIRALQRGHDPAARRRIAGMTSGGGTRLSPAFAAAVASLAAHPAQRKLLVVLHDGDLDADDAAAVRQQISVLPRRRMHLLPLYLGGDPTIIAANERVFGHVLACPELSEMTAQVRAWLRATRA